MTTTQAPGPHSQPLPRGKQLPGSCDHPLAQRVTNILEPKNWIIPMLGLLGWNAARWAGLGWALVIGVFAAVLPVLFIRHGMRHWHWGDRHVGDRSERMTALAFIIASDAAGSLLMWTAGAPHKMTGYMTGILLTSIVIAVITPAWKISVHCAVASTAVLILALTYHMPAILAAYTGVLLVAWSRVRLKDHTPAQVTGGIILGAIVALLTYLAVS